MTVILPGLTVCVAALRIQASAVRLRVRRRGQIQEREKQPWQIETRGHISPQRDNPRPMVRRKSSFRHPLRASSRRGAESGIPYRVRQTIPNVPFALGEGG